MAERINNIFPLKLHRLSVFALVRLTMVRPR